MMDKNEQAINSFKKALELDENYVEARLNLGNAYSKINKNEDEIRQYKKTIELDPKMIEAHCNLATQYHGIGKLH